MLLRYSWLPLILVLTACQTEKIKQSDFHQKVPLRAILTQQNNHWIATSCTSDSKEHFQLIDEANLAMDASQLLKKSNTLFMDAVGFVNNKPTDSREGVFTVKKINRLTLDSKRGCGETDYNRIVVRSVGKNPLWFTSIAIKGLVLERVNEQPLVLPYVAEQLPGGQMNFSTDANGQHIELWVAPERCEDEETGEVYAMTARLTVNFQSFRGCAYLGQAGVHP